MPCHRKFAKKIRVPADLERNTKIVVLKRKNTARVYIDWGGIYIDMKPPDFDKAEEIYRLGLERCTCEIDEIYTCLRELDEEYGRY